MLWKCCTQNSSKFGKLSSGHRTGKGQFSFQSQRKEMPKNVQTTAQLYSFHMLAKEVLILWAPDVKSQLIRKDPDVGKDWRQEKGMTEDEMVGWHNWFNGHKFEQALGDDEGQGSLEYCSPWGCKGSDTTEWLNNSDSILQWGTSQQCRWTNCCSIQL